MRRGPGGQTSIHIDASPERVYDLVSDIRRMGEWSPLDGLMLGVDDPDAGLLEGMRTAFDRIEDTVEHPESSTDGKALTAGAHTNRRYDSDRKHDTER